MTSRKRWEKIYTKQNPFTLPQSVARAVRSCSRDHISENGKHMVKYMWLYISADGFHDQAQPDQCMSGEEWLSVIDEGAALGVKYVILSIGGGLKEHPEVWRMCKWAQDTHGITVGIHLYDQPVTREELAPVTELDANLTHLFIDDDLLQRMSFVQELGVPVHSGEGQDQEIVSPDCHLPEEMTCVGASGTMYTCGLVLGEDEYRLGNVFERKLQSIMTDDSLPHVVPEGVPKIKHHCNGCPPLMIKRMKNGSHS